MKTIYLHGSPDFYGSGKVLLEILRIPTNTKNAIVVFPHEGPLCNAVRELGIPLYIINMGVLRRKYFTPWGLLSRVYYWITATLTLQKIIQANDVQLIYVNSLNIIIGPWLKRITQLPLIWHLHEIIEEPKLLFRFLHQLLRKADKIIAVSKAVQFHWSQLPLPQPVRVLYNGFSDLSNQKEKSFFSSISEQYKKTANGIVIGMIGRVQPLKGHSYLLEILQHLIKSPSYHYPGSIQLIIAGDAYPGYSHLTLKLKKEISDRGLNNFVDYIGYQEDIKGLLEKIDILIVPSIKPDSLPTVVIEAMLAGKPVIATRQGGCLELIEENITGYFIPVNDSMTSSKILHQLLSNKEQLEKAGVKGKQRAAELFSLASFQRGWLKIMNG